MTAPICLDQLTPEQLQAAQARLQHGRIGGIDRDALAELLDVVGDCLRTRIAVPSVIELRYATAVSVLADSTAGRSGW